MRRLAAAAALLMCTLSCAAAWRIPNSGGRGPARRLAQTDAWATDQDLWGCPFAEGDVVYCNKTGHPRFGQVVRVENATLHVYPSRESWEYDGSPQPTEASEEACDKLDNCPEGEPMPEEDLLPAPEREYTAAPQVPSPQQPVQSCPLPEGSVVACLDNTAGGIGIGRVEGGRVRWYPTDEAYKADGSPAIGYSSSTTTCSMVRQCGDGLPMPAPVCPFKNGDVVRCTTTGAIAKMVGGRLRGYPNPASFEADGTPAWTFNSAAVCEQAKMCPEGEPMPQGAPAVTTPAVAAPAVTTPAVTTPVVINLPPTAAAPPPSDGGSGPSKLWDGLKWAAGAAWNLING